MGEIESAGKEMDEENAQYFSCDERSGVGSRSISFSFDDNDSCFELSIRGLSQTENTDFEFQAAVAPVRPTLVEIFARVEAPAADELAKIAPAAGELGKIAPAAGELGKIAPAADELGKIAPAADELGKIVPAADELGKFAPAADELGQIAPPDKLGESSLPEKSPGGRDCGERFDNEMGGPATLPVGGEVEHHREMFGPDNRQMILATRKNNNLLSAALQSEYIRNIFKAPVQRLRMALKSNAKPKGEEKEEEHNTKSSAPAQAAATATRSSPPPVLRKLWAPIYDWFTFNKPGRGGNPPKPKMVEVSGQGSMIGMLKDIAAGKKNAKGRPSSSRGEQKGRISRSAPASPRHRSAFASRQGEKNMERDVSIGPAILHCKLSHLAQEI